MLTIRNLHASVEEMPILKGLDLTVNPGEIHAIMGPNGSGKSTLSNVITGRPGYTVSDGSITFLGEDLLEMDAEDRARAGIFLSFQYPVEIPGVSNAYFLKAALNAQRKARGEEEVDAFEFLKLARTEIAKVGLDKAMLSRAVNDGFSGGEKKRNEMFQMALLEPKLALLDEVDSGLDVDALRAVADGINSQRRPDRAVVLITHYQRLLDYVTPDFVHIIVDGRIARSGDKSLALEVEERGYGWIQNLAAAG